jgi:hypothetical protein
MTSGSGWLRVMATVLTAAGLLAASSSTASPHPPGHLRRCGGNPPATCGADAYCAKTNEACPINGGPGVCKARPRICPDAFIGVCGCDRVTYTNTCQAERAGVSVARNGRCERRVLGVIVHRPVP